MLTLRDSTGNALSPLYSGSFGTTVQYGHGIGQAGLKPPDLAAADGHLPPAGGAVRHHRAVPGAAGAEVTTAERSTGTETGGVCLVTGGAGFIGCAGLGRLGRPLRPGRRDRQPAPAGARDPGAARGAGPAGGARPRRRDLGRGLGRAAGRRPADSGAPPGRRDRHRPVADRGDPARDGQRGGHHRDARRAASATTPCPERVRAHLLPRGLRRGRLGRRRGRPALPGPAQRRDARGRPVGLPGPDADAVRVVPGPADADERLRLDEAGPGERPDLLVPGAGRRRR